MTSGPGPRHIVGTGLLLLLLSIFPRSASGQTIVNCVPEDPAGNADLLCTGNPCIISGSYNMSDGCVFDFGTRTVRVRSGTLSVGTGQMRFATGPFVLESTGKLKGKGGPSTPGGRIEIEAAGAVTIAGLIDVSGNSAGDIAIAAEEVTVSGEVLADGLGLDGDGGTIDVEGTGAMTIGGTLSAEGSSDSSGGSVFLSAGSDLTITRLINASGGSGDGGDIIIEAGDDVLISRPLVATSVANAGSGGQIDIAAGQDYLAGNSHDGGTLTVADNITTLGNSSGTGENADCGDGGSISLAAQGDITVSGGVAFKANGASPFCGGGTILMDSTDTLWDEVTPLDGNVILKSTGSIEATGGGADGFGGDVEITAGNDATLSKSIDVSGNESGGEILVEAGRNAKVKKNLSSDASSVFGAGGTVEVTAGNSTEGTLLVSARSTISADGRPMDEETNGGDITLGGCDVLIDAGATISARGADPNRGSIEVAAAKTLDIGSQAELTARFNGLITLVHRPGHPPVLGTGVDFDPSYVVEKTTLRSRFPYCPFCGNGWVDAGEECDDGNPVAGDCCSPLCLAEDLGTVACGQGVCRREEARCAGGEPSPTGCAPGGPTEPGSETSCDGLDNDCDGEVDEDNPGGGAACDTGQPGVCAEGTEQCQGGSLVCTASNSPSPEACDGLDNDCNGAVDDGCSTPGPTPSPTTTPAPTPSPAPSASPSPSPTPVRDVKGSAKAVAKCARAIGKAASRLVRDRQKALAKCANQAFKCVQVAGSEDLTDCLGKAGIKCEKAVRSFLDRAAPKFDRAVRKGCPPQRRGALIVPASDLSGALGFDGCIGNAEPGVAPLAAVIGCVEGAASCRADEIFGTEAPRTIELLSLLRAAHPPLVDLVGGTGADPGGGLDLGCLPPADGAGGSLNDPRGSGKAAANCQKALLSAGAKLALKRFDSVRRCGDAVLPCVLERDAGRRSSCLSKVRGKCTRTLAALARNRRDLRTAVSKRCGAGEVLRSELRAGEGLDFADAEQGVCQDVGVNALNGAADVAECLVREHECAIDRVAREVSPRIDELLAEVGKAIGSAVCP